MMRWMAFLLGVLMCASTGRAQAPDPQITVTAEQEEVIVGQPFIAQVDVLVPSFMPKAPVFPTFEVPGLIVRLPERSTVPISERIDGATWAGVRRTYRIYPMQAGITEIPAQELAIVYRDMETNEDVGLTVQVPATRVRAVVPPGARTLDPLIVAQGISISQSWQQRDGALAVGDAVVRQLEVSVKGASALFVPPLLGAAAPAQSQQASDASEDDEIVVATFMPYPEDSRVIESIERGILSGTRKEQVSYIAQSGGEALFPDISLRWFNLGTAEIEEIVVPGQQVYITIPPQARMPLDWQAALRGVLLLALAVILVWAGHRWFWPSVRPRIELFRDRYDKTALAAHRTALNAAAERDLNQLMIALYLRRKRGHAPSRMLEQAYDRLTRAIYRDGAEVAEVGRHWQTLRRALRQDAPGLFQAALVREKQGLPPLNPFVER